MHQTKRPRQPGRQTRGTGEVGQRLLELKVAVRSEDLPGTVLQGVCLGAFGDPAGTRTVKVVLDLRRWCGMFPG
jgi:hypothetical protein